MEKVKTAIVTLLNRATMRYLRRGKVRIIAVAGSVGKTSTVNAIRTVLAQKYRVHQPSTAYNTNKSVHLEIFNQKFATSLPAWLLATCTMLLKSLGKPRFEVLVIEIGTDHPGELQSFAFLQPEIGVLTAIAPEHMEFFKTIEAVAAEELSAASFCKQFVINQDAVASHFVPAELWQSSIRYGTGTAYNAAHYRLKDMSVTADFAIGPFSLQDQSLQVIGEHSLQALLAAGAVAELCGLNQQQIADGIQSVKPVSGRMQPLKGLDGSIIIDDTYNASPEASKAALDVLYRLDLERRIAILGAMNEMGEYSLEAHREVGEYCDPAKLALVVTVGDDATKFLAPAARAKGCTVQSFDNPYDAGNYVRQALEADVKPTAILAKGSQNLVFCEEAVKMLLADPADAAKLVRQSDFWMQRKRSQFGDPLSNESPQPSQNMV